MLSNLPQLPEVLITSLEFHFVTVHKHIPGFLCSQAIQKRGLAPAMEEGDALTYLLKTNYTERQDIRRFRVNSGRITYQALQAMLKQLYDPNDCAVAGYFLQAHLSFLFSFWCFLNLSELLAVVELESDCDLGPFILPFVLVSSWVGRAV